MANFSGAIKLADVNDFISPSQACVVSLNGGKLQQGDTEEKVGEVILQSRSAPQGFSQTVPSGEDGSIKVTLHDCLACSGCVTSAESILLEQQSTAELLARLEDPQLHVIVSVSPQSRASLAAFLGLSVDATFRKVTHFLHALGVRAVLDTSASRDLSLLETAEEFVARYRACRPRTTAGVPLQTVDGTSVRDRGQAQFSMAPQCLPQLASACPGWVCYAEKTHGEYILPYISTAKSPQAVMGSIVKGPLCRRLGLQPSQVYHCAIMPCYDKKLEASREDFNVAGSSVSETDCVLTSGELQQLAMSRGVDLAALPESPLDSLLDVQDGQLYGWPGGSGGYLDFVFRTAAKDLFGVIVPPGPLAMRTLRNADFQEATLEVEGKVVLRFALAYGFRNIQTLMRKIKRRACEYHYVEVMACPGGCLNGGGQIKPGTGVSQSQLLDALDQAYHSPKVVRRTPQENPLVSSLYKDWIGGGVLSEPAWKVLHTQYHHRSKPANAVVADW